ncbi:MAG: GNAT family N-acetyltransferase [Candidatus Hodarchaeales archaeon]
MVEFFVEITFEPINGVVDDFMLKEWESSNMKNFGRVIAPEEFSSPLVLTAWTKDPRELVGVAKCKIVGKTVRLHQLLVKEEYREKKGIGSLLLKKIETLCKQKQWHKIRLSTSDKHSNIDFYRKCGYEIEATLPNDAFGFKWFILAKYPLENK